MVSGQRGAIEVSLLVLYEVVCVDGLLSGYIKEAFVGKKINKKTGKQAMHYKCAACKKHHVAKDVQVDHIHPVVDPTTGFVSWDVYIDRLFCESYNLQVLCSTCHKKKTAGEKIDAKRGRSVVTPHD
jgi:ribosomal protein L44E